MKHTNRKQHKNIHHEKIRDDFYLFITTLISQAPVPFFHK